MHLDILRALTCVCVCVCVQSGNLPVYLFLSSIKVFKEVSLLQNLLALNC
jgi:hypothetical protein